MWESREGFRQKVLLDLFPCQCLLTLFCRWATEMSLWIRPHDFVSKEEADPHAMSPLTCLWNGWSAMFSHWGLKHCFWDNVSKLNCVGLPTFAQSVFPCTLTTCDAQPPKVVMYSQIIIDTAFSKSQRVLHGVLYWTSNFPTLTCFYRLLYVSSFSF